MDQTTAAAQPWAPTTAQPELPQPRRRTLGICAHCGEPVDATQDYVRLYRRAWHLDCALVAEPDAGPDAL